MTAVFDYPFDCPCTIGYVTLSLIIPPQAAAVEAQTFSILAASFSIYLGYSL